MSQEQAKQFLNQGITAARAGQQDHARKMFQNALRLDPQNETAWLWMSSVARNNQERLFCLQNLLQVNPQNEMALKGLRALGVDPASLLRQQQQTQEQSTGSSRRGTPTGTAPGIPALDQSRLNALLGRVDQFMRSYSPVPTVGGEGWTRKRGRRYGEAAALRRRVIRTGGLALLLLLLLGGAALGIITLLGGEEPVEVAGPSFVTATASPTRTATATATEGVTNTPSPEPDQPLLPTFQPPSGLARGDIYGGTATPFYPQLEAEYGRDFEQALQLASSSRYFPTAVGTLQAVRASNNNTIRCYPDMYYYEIVGLVELGGRRNLEDAQAVVDAYENDPNCNDSPLMSTAACYANYAQAELSGDETLYAVAARECDTAFELLGQQPPIVLTTLTRARLHMREGDYQAARSLLDRGLRNWGSDIGLLLLRAQVESESGNLNEALEYISRALYVDPVSEPALQARVETYLRVAEQTSDAQRRLQLYGTAVLWAQEYLLYYPGAPAAYLVLAQARLGEGNLRLAEDALNRIIANEGSLPAGSEDELNAAFTLRARIYRQTARYEEALADVQTALQDDPTDLVLLQQQAELALTLGQYPLAVEGLEAILPQLENASDDEAVSERNRLQLLRLRLSTQICAFVDGVACDYEGALELLSDDFIAGLPPSLQAEAYSYRGKARYHVAQTLSPDEFTNAQIDNAFEEALTDIDVALAIEQSAVDLYYRGLIAEALEQPNAALAAYEWVLYWASFYDYPFTAAVEERVEALREDAS